jgi:hypothetical protein
MAKQSFIAVAIKQGTAGVNTAYIYTLPVNITWKRTCICKDLLLLLYAACG